MPFGGLPHSVISGSLAMCAYPELIAAYRDLLRLLMPRHSPCALYSLIFFQVNFWLKVGAFAPLDVFELLSITFQLMTNFSTKLFFYNFALRFKNICSFQRTIEKKKMPHLQEVILISWCCSCSLKIKQNTWMYKSVILLWEISVKWISFYLIHVAMAVTP